MLLARELGMTLAELEAKMSVEEYQIWVREYQRRPFGEDVTEQHLAILFSSLLQSWGSDVDPDELIPHWDQTTTPEHDAMAWDVWRMQVEQENRRAKGYR